MVEKISVHVRVSALNVEHNYLIPCLENPMDRGAW